jgi:serine/threonine protein kinase
MASVDHEYCLQLKGLCIAEPIMMITQFMLFGSVVTFYEKHMEKVNERMLLTWAYQIAEGMHYLESRAIVHRDLAARNILIKKPDHIKISDFGLSRIIQTNEDSFYAKTNSLVPVKWLAIESIRERKFTHKSDVWSYGVCLWEIFNYGCQTYSGCTNPEAIEMIRDRQLLLIPVECPKRAYALMLECWHEIPLQRPTFSEILNRLRNWENYYLFNGTNTNVPTMQSNVAQSIIPPQFQMTNSYSSNSQTSKTSNTATTHVNTPPLPNSLPPAITQMAQMTAYYSPSKNMTMTAANVFVSNFNKKPSPPGSTITSSSAQSNPRNYNIEVATNSLRFGQRQNNFFNQPIQMDSHFDL